MTVHTDSSRDFTCDVSAAKRAASKGPVFITDRPRPAAQRWGILGQAGMFLLVKDCN